jgi:hypothetical protein
MLDLKKIAKMLIDKIRVQLEQERKQFLLFNFAICRSFVVFPVFIFFAVKRIAFSFQVI